VCVSQQALGFVSGASLVYIYVMQCAAPISSFDADAVQQDNLQAIYSVKGTPVRSSNRLGTSIRSGPSLAGLPIRLELLS